MFKFVAEIFNSFWQKCMFQPDKGLAKDSENFEAELAKYNFRIKYRDYLVGSEAQARSQIDQIVLYVSSAGFGFVLTQITTACTNLERGLMAISLLGLGITLLITYLSFLFSSLTFSGLLQDLDKVAEIPFDKSDGTKFKIQVLNILNFLQMITFVVSLTVLVVIGSVRIAQSWSGTRNFKEIEGRGVVMSKSDNRKVEAVQKNVEKPERDTTRTYGVVPKDPPPPPPTPPQKPKKP